MFKRIAAVLGAVSFVLVLMASLPEPGVAMCTNEAGMTFPCECGCFDCGIEDMYWLGDDLVTEWACTCEDDCCFRWYMDNGEEVIGGCEPEPC